MDPVAAGCWNWPAGVTIPPWNDRGPCGCTTCPIVLAEVRASLASLEAYRGQLQARLDTGEALEQELFSVARRLATLRGRIDRASFAHKRRAVEELVKGITVATRIADGRKTPVVSITYRFEGPDSASPDAAGAFSAVGDCTLTGSLPPPA